MPGTTPVKRGRRPSSARSRAMNVKPGEPMPGEFVPMDKWDGPRPGFIYKCGAWGPGYYLTASQKQNTSRSNSTACMRSYGSSSWSS